MPKYSSYLIFDMKYYQLNAGLNNAKDIIGVNSFSISAEITLTNGAGQYRDSRINSSSIIIGATSYRGFVEFVCFQPMAGYVNIYVRYYTGALPEDGRRATISFLVINK